MGLFRTIIAKQWTNEKRGARKASSFPGKGRGRLRLPRGLPARREHRFLCKESGGKESPEGGYPPLDSPKAHPGLCSAAEVFPQHGGAKTRLGAYEESGCTAGKTRWPKAAHLEGCGEGNEKFPSPPLFPRFLFREKKPGAVRAGRLPGEGKIPQATPGPWTTWHRPRFWPAAPRGCPPRRCRCRRGPRSARRSGWWRAGGR